MSNFWGAVHCEKKIAEFVVVLRPQSHDITIAAFLACGNMLRP